MKFAFLLPLVTSIIASVLASSYTERLSWDPACDDSYYDYSATLYFCHSSRAFGYRTNADDPCESSSGHNTNSPMIRMEAGKKYQLTLINLSTSQPTNIHTHGLHIPGEANTDNVRNLAEPNGGILRYNWTIPIDHMDGTHWYHSHAHGYSVEQGQGGATGMLLIDPAADSINDQERPDWVKRERFLHVMDTSDLPIIFTQVSANGVTKETIQVEHNKWHLLRLSFVGFPPIIKQFDFSSQCELRTAAYDGVWRDQVPRQSSQSIYQLYHSNRVDFAIKCSDNGEVHYSQFPMFARLFRIIFSFFGMSDFFFPPLVTFATTGNNPDEAEPQVWTPSRPEYLRDLRNEDIDDDTFSVMVTTHDINGREYAEDNADIPLAVFDFGSTQQWTLLDGALIRHPVHLHLYHMQVVTPGGCGHIYEEGQWFDTIAPPDRGCKVRFRMTDVAGRAVLHCHVPLHAKQGALGHVYVQDGPMPDERNDEAVQEICMESI